MTNPGEGSPKEEDSPEEADSLEEEDSPEEGDTPEEEDYHLGDLQEVVGDHHHHQCPYHKPIKENW